MRTPVFLNSTAGEDASGPHHSAADRLVAALGLPGDDLEVQQLTAVLLGALESVLRTGEGALLDDALDSAHRRLVTRGLLGGDMVHLAEALKDAADPQLDTQDKQRLSLLMSSSSGSGSAGSGVTETDDLSDHGAEGLNPLTAAYVERLLAGDRAGVAKLTSQYVADGMDMFDILVDVLEPAQREVGRLWGMGLISIAQEHFCTAVTQFVMTSLYPFYFTGEESTRRLVAVRVPGSTHNVGLRMVTDVLECRGWSTSYLVEDVSADLLPGVVAEERADLLLISASMPGHVTEVGLMIRAIREDPRTNGVKVVVGGRPFGVAPGLVEAVGADGWARDARSAVEVCDELVEARS